MSIINTLNTLTLRFHSDAGHGWLEVPKHEVQSLGIKPSRYSYQNNGNFYLEEDCDAMNFIQAYKKKCGVSPEIHHMPPSEGDHPIRGFFTAY